MKPRKQTQRLNHLLGKAEAKRRDRLYDRGFALGRDWARVSKNAEGVVRLKALFDSGDIDDWYSWFETSERDRQIKFIKFALILHPDWRSIDDWVEPTLWKSQLAGQAECNVCHPHFMRGFAEGALSELRETRDEK